jgi:uncharacterized membrane protein
LIGYYLRSSMNFATDNINNNSTNKSSSSLILTARYGHESSKLIHLIERNLYIVIGIIAFMAVLSIVNALGFHYLFEYSDDIDFIVDISLAVILIAMVIPLIILLLKSRKSLDRWDNMFETNTLSISMGIAMANRTKEEAFRAIIQSVEQINQPLNDYVTASKSNFKEFMDVSVDKNITLDILIDSNHVLNGNNDNDNSLRNILKVYGAIIVKIFDGRVNRVSVESYVNSLLQYISRTKNKVGLAIIIGEEINADTQEYARQLLRKHVRSGKINNLILIEKPSLPSHSSSGSQEAVIPK